MISLILKNLKEQDIKEKIKKISNFLADKSILAKPIERNQKAQQVSDELCQNLRLYQTNTCPYCLKVRLKIRELGLNIELVNINEGNNREELIEYGGKSQVPCLRVLSKNNDNPAKDKWIYESNVINRYLEENFQLLTKL